MRLPVFARPSRIPGTPEAPPAEQDEHRRVRGNKVAARPRRTSDVQFPPYPQGSAILAAAVIAPTAAVGVSVAGAQGTGSTGRPRRPTAAAASPTSPSRRQAGRHPGTAQGGDGRRARRVTRDEARSQGRPRRGSRHGGRRQHRQGPDDPRQEPPGQADEQAGRWRQAREARHVGTRRRAQRRPRHREGDRPGRARQARRRPQGRSQRARCRDGRGARQAAEPRRRDRSGRAGVAAPATRGDRGRILPTSDKAPPGPSGGVRVSADADSSGAGSRPRPAGRDRSCPRRLCSRRRPPPCRPLSRCRRSSGGASVHRDL